MDENFLVFFVIYTMIIGLFMIELNEYFSNPTKWNDFYEAAWLKRQEIMSSLIKSGETHPLRIIKLFSSIIRFSTQEFIPDEGSSENTRFVFNEDSDYVNEDILNVTILKENTAMTVTPSTLLPSGMKADKKHAHRSNYSSVSSYTSCNKIEFLTDYCRERKFDAVIELGSGYGQNLIELFYQGGPRVPYYAGEFTKSGTDCAKMLGNLMLETELIPFRFDFRNPDLSMIPRYKKVLVFTSHSIEQVGEIPDNLIPAICDLAEQVTCIHIEPFGYQLSSIKNENEVDKNQRQYFKENSWNKNLVRQLVYHSCNEKIDLQYIGKNVLGGGDAHNPSSLALWKSN